MLFLFLTIFFIFLTGCTILTYSAWHPSCWSDAIVASCGIGTGVIGSAVLLLVSADLYTKPALFGLGAMLLAVAMLRKNQLLARLPSRPKNRVAWGQSALLIGVMLVMGWVNFRPHQPIFGAADSGLYLSIAGQMAREGDILLDEPIIDTLDSAQFETFIRTQEEQPIWSAGFTIEEDSHQIIPRFYHFHSAWQSIPFLLGNGLSDALSFAPLWGWFSLLTVHAILHRLFPTTTGRWLAIAGVAGMGLTSLQQWFTRYSTTESLTQWMVWFGIWAWIVWANGRYQSRLFASLAGFGWAIAHLTRIDTFFLWGATGTVFIALLLTNHRKTVGWFIAPQLLGQIGAILYAYRFSPYYVDELYGLIWNAVQKSGGMLGLASILALGILFIAWKKQAELRQFTTTYHKHGRIALIVLLAGMFLYNWFLRPILGDSISYIATWGSTVEQWNHENLVRMKWYVSTFVVWLGIIGLLYTLWHAKHRSFGWLFVGLLYTIFYLYNIRSNGIHMYALRRYVPFTVPFITICIVYLLNGVARWRGKIGGGISFILLCGWIFGVANGSRGLLSQVDYQSAVEQFETFESSFEPSSIILFGQQAPLGIADHLGVPLSLIYDHQMMVIQQGDSTDQLQAMITEWQQSADVYWVELENELAWPYPEWELEEIAPLHFSMSALETVYDRRPTAISAHEWRGQIYQIPILE